MSKNVVTTTVTPAEIRLAWDTIQAGRNPLSGKQSALDRYVKNNYRSKTVDPWVGDSGTGIQHKLNNGYWPEGEEMPNLSGSTVTIDTPQVEWHEEEGELIYEAMLNNEELMFVQWDAMPQPKGMKIRACFDFNAGVRSEMIAEYFSWVLNVIERAEGLGISPDVELYIETQGSFQGHDSRHDMIVIPVVKAGELVDTVAWRAYLTQGGFRSLGFLALGLTGDKHGLSLTSGLGRATGDGWDVKLDGDVLTIHADGNASRFPKDEMNAKLEAAFQTF